MSELDRFLSFAVERGASDLHLTTGVRPVLRIHGDMRPVADQVPEITVEQFAALFDAVVPERILPRATPVPTRPRPEGTVLLVAVHVRPPEGLPRAETQTAAVSAGG